MPFPRGAIGANRINLQGQRFGRLLVTGGSETRGKLVFWRCRCDCGNQAVVRSQALRNDRTKSCGCLQRETTIARSTLHGLSKTSTYLAWLGMRRRCDVPTDLSYPNYGGRGITVCAQWQSFDVFLRDMGIAPKDTSLDRIDPNGPYSPSNCRWADRKTQNRNRRTAVLITLDGETHCLGEWAELIGVKYGTLYARIARMGHSPEVALRAGRNHGKPTTRGEAA